MLKIFTKLYRCTYRGHRKFEFPLLRTNRYLYFILGTRGIPFKTAVKREAFSFARLAPDVRTAADKVYGTCSMGTIEESIDSCEWSKLR